MNTIKTLTTIAALAAFAATAGVAHAKGPVTIKIETPGTIKVGDYETVCDKKPKACGSDYDPLGPRPKPKPKPSKLIGGSKTGPLQLDFTITGARR